MPRAATLHMLSDASRACDDCRLRARCLPDHLGDTPAREVTGVIRAHRPVPRGTVLFRQGEPMTAFYLVRSGSAKSTVTDEDGSEVVMSLLLPTDMVGAGSLDQTVYHSTVVALERSAFCEIRTPDLRRLFRQDEEVQRAFLAKVRERIAADRHARIRLGHASADARVADFVLELSGRLAALGRRPDELVLPLSRQDIASCLGLASETVSRVLTRFTEAGLLSVSGKHVRIIDRPVLEAVAHGAEPPN